MTRAQAEIEMNRRLDRILDLLSNPTPELKIAIRLSMQSAEGEKSHRKTPDYDAVCQRVMKSLGYADRRGRL